MKLIIIFSCILFSGLASCKKETVLKNETIVGKWKLVQTYDGYGNGGSFTWTNTPENYSKQIEFTATGQFYESYNLGGSLQTCTGTYQILADSTLEKKSSCSTMTESNKISKKSNTILILNYQGREGLMKEKYIPVN